MVSTVTVFYPADTHRSYPALFSKGVKLLAAFGPLYFVFRSAQSHLSKKTIPQCLSPPIPSLYFFIVTPMEPVVFVHYLSIPSPAELKIDMTRNRACLLLGFFFPATWKRKSCLQAIDGTGKQIYLQVFTSDTLALRGTLNFPFK